MSLSKEIHNKIKKYIIENVSNNPHGIAREISENFQMSRASACNHLNRLVTAGILQTTGRGRASKYLLKENIFKKIITLNSNISEDTIWREEIKPVLPKLNKNLLDICSYGFTEMFNNVIDHSEAEEVEIILKESQTEIIFVIQDNGIGIFKKIQTFLNLETPNQAILELAKGKLTSSPDRHSGEGIFFTSRVFDNFKIVSGDISFISENKKDFLYEFPENFKGTAVVMTLSKNSEKKLEDVFDQFSDKENYGFSKTVIPIKLLEHEGGTLISRSQAKRLITRFEKFKEVMLDFSDIETIGQSFADEVFRVFQKKYPDTHLTPINTSYPVLMMIGRAITLLNENKKK
ncbi:DUF4325 domain-containing protein [bacterium]|nr:DUF4325 domain-containing protein [bacterium]